MPRSRVYKCTNCGQSHPKPTGKHCPWQQEDRNDTTPDTNADMSVVTRALQVLSEKMDDFGARLATVEDRPDDGTNDGEASSEEENTATGGELSPAHTSTQRTDPHIPSVQELRRDYAIGREVNRRLAEMGLQDDDDELPPNFSQRKRGKRSGAARTVKDSVVNDIDWPHFHIYTQPGDEAMTFERLSIPEFVYGYLHMVDQPEAKLDRQVMWDLLKEMMEDATEYPWPNIRNFFWVVGSHVENDRMKWADRDSIQKLRVKHAQKHEIVPVKPAANAGQAIKLRPCTPYQQGQCTEKGDHTGLRHICAFCYRTKSTPYPHPEKNCRRKATDELAKNGNGGE